MKLKFSFIILLLIMLLGCRDVFTTSRLSFTAKSVDDMTETELTSYIKDVDLKSLKPEVLSSAETALANNRVTIDDLDQDDEIAVAKYLEDTALLLEINKEQADVEGLLTSALSASEGSDSENFVDNLLSDTERIENLKEASGYVADTFALDPDSLSSTDLIVGSAGILGDILQDETKTTNLSGVDDYETATLETAGFTANEIEDIQTATNMLTAAQEGLSDDMAGMLEGLLF